MKSISKGNRPHTYIIFNPWIHVVQDTSLLNFDCTRFSYQLMLKAKYFFFRYTELQISCVFAFFKLWKRVKTHVLSDQSVHITHAYCCVIKPSKFGAYLYADNYSRVHWQYSFVFEKFPVITPLYTFRMRERMHPRGTECLPFSKEIWLDAYDKSSNRGQYYK